MTMINHQQSTARLFARRCVLGVLIAAPLVAFAGGCQPAKVGTIEEICAIEGTQITGVAVSKSGRIFTNAPRWHDDFGGVSVFEVTGPTELTPYPPVTSGPWNAWTPSGELPASDTFVCVQSVVVDALDRLWVLDAASPAFGGVVPGGPKLVQIDLKTNRVVRVYGFDETIAPTDSYLNDVRVDVAGTGHAFITDSGRGGLVVLDLASGLSRRVLDKHPSVLGQPGFVPVIDSREVMFPDGKLLVGHSDGIALDVARGYLYWQALTDLKLYRLPTRLLKNLSLTAEQLSEAIEAQPVYSAVDSDGAGVMTDGIEVDGRGNVYYTAVEQNAIMLRQPSGTLVTIVKDDDRLIWPDSLSWVAANTGGTALYVSTSQIHRTKWFSADQSQPAGPYRILKINLPANLARPLVAP